MNVDYLANKCYLVGKKNAYFWQKGMLILVKNECLFLQKNAYFWQKLLLIFGKNKCLLVGKNKCLFLAKMHVDYLAKIMLLSWQKKNAY